MNAQYREECIDREREGEKLFPPSRSIKNTHRPAHTHEILFDYSNAIECADKEPSSCKLQMRAQNTNTHTHTYTHKHSHAHINTYTPTWTHTRPHEHIHILTHSYTCTHAHANKQTHMQTHAHKQTCNLTTRHELTFLQYQATDLWFANSSLLAQLAERQARFQDSIAQSTQVDVAVDVHVLDLYFRIAIHALGIRMIFFLFL